MSARTLTLVIVGQRAAVGRSAAGVTAALSSACPVAFDTRECWVDVAADVPARVTEAITAATSPQILVVTVDADGRHAVVDDLARALLTRGGLVVGQRAGDAALRCGPVGVDDFLDRLARAWEDAATRPAWPTRPCEAWGIDRDAFVGLGGLDARMAGPGDVDDLARRALARGVAVEFVDLDGPIVEAHRRDPAQATYEGIRNGLVSAALHGTEEDSGRRVAIVAAHAIAAAWRSCGVDPAILTFSGNWARPRALDRWLATPGLREGDALWPREPDSAIRPLLAIDAALATLAARAGDRVRPVALSRASADTTPSAPAVDAQRSKAAPTPGGATTPLPSASVIVVNWNGREHLGPLFTSLCASDYPADRLELICVDNGSTDDSREWLASAFPRVKVVALPENRGFTGGNVAGVADAHGDVLVFLNNDMRVEPDALRRLVEALDDDHPCAGACVLSWDGARIDFLRGTASWEARGFQEHYGEPHGTLPTLDTDATFFPNGGAFAITREMYERAGGFDPAFFAYYDDLDLGWGVRLAGGHIRVVRDAIVYHRHGATSSGQPVGQKKYLLERNALWTMVKRYGDDTLGRALGAGMLLAVRRFVHDAAVTVARDPQGVPTRIALRRAPMERLAALGEAVRGLPATIATRRALMVHRRVSDRHVVSRMGRTLEGLSSRTEYREAQARLLEILGLDKALRGRSRVLLLTHEPLRSQMSGPGVRVLELGRALASAGAAVTVASPFDSDLRETAFTIARHAGTDDAVRDLAALHDVVVVQGFALDVYPTLATMPLVLVADLYCPFTIENLEMRSAALAAAPSASDAARFAAEAAGALAAQNRQLALGDFFICASERQRDYWLGALQAMGRLTLGSYGDDPSLRSLIDVVPFGMPDRAAPARTRSVMKGVIPGIGRSDTVLLWAGSILDWQDPQLLIRAVARLRETRQDVKLVFMGTRHPNPAVPPMRAVPECIALAESLGVANTHVFFNDWVAYGERHEWLLEADLGVSTHRDHLETHFSFRTRMLDYFWAGLPMVATRGDVFADEIEAHGLGLTVPASDEDALVAALTTILGDADLRARCAVNVRQRAASMTWNTVAAPLVRFCANPRQAADRRPATEAFHRRLRSQFRLTKWLKRTAVRMGMSDARIDQLKQTALVRQAMILRNRRAYAKARRG